LTEDVLFETRALQHILHAGVGRDFRTFKRVTFLCLNFKPQRPGSYVAFIALPKKGRPELELTSRYWRNSNAFSFGMNSHSTLTLCAKTFAGQYANKRRGAIEDGGLFVTANYWGFLPDSRMNDCTKQQNGKCRDIYIGTW